jgi:hypothetical protein
VFAIIGNTPKNFEAKKVWNWVNNLIFLKLKNIYFSLLVPHRLVNPLAQSWIVCSPHRAKKLILVGLNKNSS